MEESIHMEDPYELLPELLEFTRGPHRIPFTRVQHVVNTTNTVKNIKEGKTNITIDFKNRHQRFCRSAEGEVTTLANTAFPPMVVSTFPRFLSKCELDEESSECLWSSTERHSLIHSLLSCINLESPSELARLETEVCQCLFNLVSTAKDEGYSAIDVVVFIEVATVDTYDAEEVALALRRIRGEYMSVAHPTPRSCPASRSSIEGLFSQVFDDANNSSDKCCSICLDEYSCGMTVTRLPCAHDFHRGCIERWLNLNNLCPICRSPI